MKLLTRLGIFALAFALPFSAGAAVKKEGNWPVTEKKVDLTFDGAASDGLKKLAKEASWSLVIANGVGVDRDGADVHVDVKGQPADAVLEALFVGQDVVAHRNGSLVTIRPAKAEPEKAAVPAVPPVPPVPPPAAVPEPPPPPPVPAAVPSVRGEDRNVVGGSATIKKGEVVHTVTLAGGTLKVEGTVTGDLVVAGGSAKVLRGAHVVGNATVFGGGLKIENGGRIDGDVAVMGGSVKREKGAIVGGHVVDSSRHSDDDDDDDDDDDKSDRAHPDPAPPAQHRSHVKAAIEDFGKAMTKMSLLFVLGCVLLALLGPRMERVRVDIASRPMRAFAIGLVTTLVGSIGAGILLAVLCITILGIPVAIALVLFAVLAVYGGIAAVLTTCGAAVLGHRTQNPYVHLLVGCGAFLVLSSIPWIGGLVTFALTMISIGALVATRVGGLLDRFAKRPPSNLV
jgi:hypothetical protein